MIIEVYEDKNGRYVSVEYKGDNVNKYMERTRSIRLTNGRSIELNALQTTRN